MKKNVHPDLHNITVICNCGNKFNIKMTININKLNIEVCNNCHPFYTGKQKIIDVSGRVDNFYRKFNKLKNNS